MEYLDSPLVGGQVYHSLGNMYTDNVSPIANSGLEMIDNVSYSISINFEFRREYV